MSVEIIYDTHALSPRQRGRTGEVCLSNDDFGALTARSPYDASWALARSIPLPNR
jgi:hypothetical protein